MAIIEYACDVCKRNIELQQNLTGLETPNRCIITHGCRGALYQTRVLTDFIRGTTPPSVAGLIDYQQRKVLFDYTQTIESQEWIIEHNLGTAPAASVFIKRPTNDDPNFLMEIIPELIEVVSTDSIKITFLRPESGIAQLVARASDPQLLQPVVNSTEVEIANVQVTTTSEFTIATRTSFPAVEPVTIDLQLTYTTSGGVEIPHLYTGISAPTITSPYVGVDRVVVGFDILTVRSFNIIIPEHLNGIITNGSTVRVTGVDHGTGLRSLVGGELFFMLTNPPFGAVDTNRSQFIDGGDVAGEDNPFAFFFDQSELFAQETIVKNIHPAIMPVNT